MAEPRSRSRNKIFVSSSMRELPDERTGIKRLLDADPHFEPWLFESEAGAQPRSNKTVWDDSIDQAVAVVLMLYNSAGIFTQDEFETTRAKNVKLLVYVKKQPDGSIAPAVEEYLRPHVDPIHGTFTYFPFADVDELTTQLQRDLTGLISILASDSRDPERLTAGSRQAVENPDGKGFVVSEAAPPKAVLRSPDDLMTVGRHRGRFVTRKREMATISQRLADDTQFVALEGPPGSGKKTLIKHVVHSLTDPDVFPDGVGVEPDLTDAGGAGDVLQAVWDSFYEIEGPGRLTSRQRDKALRKLKSQIVLADVTLAREDYRQIGDALGEATLLVSTERSNADDPPIPVAALSDDDELVAMFETGRGSPIPPAARSDIVTIGEALDRIADAVRMVGRSTVDIGADHDLDDAAHPLIGWARDRAQMSSGETLEPLVDENLSPVAEYTAAAGVATPRRLLIDLTGSAEAVDRALDAEIVREGSPRYRVNETLLEVVEPDDPAPLLDEMLDLTLVWMVSAEPAELNADRAFVIRMLDWASETGRWPEALAIARVAEPAIAAGGAWDAWADVLGHGLAAARELDDAEAEAWALHEMGTCALLDDHLDRARTYLHEALDARESLGDRRGAEVTRHNLRLLPLAISGLLAVAAAVAAVIAAGVPFPHPDDPSIDLEPEIVVVGSDAASQQFELTTTGGVKVVSVAPYYVEAVVEAAGCLGEAKTDRACSFEIDAAIAQRLAGDTAVTAIEFEVQPLDGPTGDRVAGDRRIRIIRPAPDPGG